MTNGHDLQQIWSDQPAGPPQGLIWHYFDGKKYTEAEPRDFFTIGGLARSGHHDNGCTAGPALSARVGRFHFAAIKCRTVNCIDECCVAMQYITDDNKPAGDITLARGLLRLAAISNGTIHAANQD
jgi:hypothetical protein